MNLLRENPLMKQKKCKKLRSQTSSWKPGIEHTTSYLSAGGTGLGCLDTLRTVLAGSDLQGIKPRLDLVHPLLRAVSGAARLLPNIQ